MADKTEQIQKFVCVIMLLDIHLHVADSRWDSTQPHLGLSLETWTESTAIGRAKKQDTLNPFDASYSQQPFSFLTVNASRPGDDYPKEIMTAQAQGPVLSYKNEEMVLEHFRWKNWEQTTDLLCLNIQSKINKYKLHTQLGWAN